MKKILFSLIFLAFAIFASAQEAGRIAMVKVFEFYGVGPIKPYVETISTDNSIESIDLEKTRRGDSAEQISNDKKIREALDKLAAKGVILKTSNQTAFGADNSFVMTTYVFEKK